MAARKTGDVESSQYGLGFSFNHDTKNPLVNNGEYRACVSYDQSKINEIRDDFAQNTSTLRSALVSAGVPNRKVTDSMRALRDIKDFSKMKDQRKIESVKEALDGQGVTLDSSALERLTFETSPVLENLALSAKTFSNVVQTCAKSVSKWNRNVYAVGLAGYTTDSDGVDTSGNESEMENAMSTDDGDATGWGAWLSLALQAGEGGQFHVHGRYNEDLVRSREVDEVKVVEHVDAWSVGTRYTHMLMDKADKQHSIRGFIEAAYTEEEFGMIKDDFWQAGIGAEFAIGNGLFFQVVLGDTFSSEIDRSTYLSGQLKWSFTKGPAE